MIKWLTFDCYGTLIDWEAGVAAALLPRLPGSVDRAQFTATYIEVEAEVERESYRRYRDVLDLASRRLLARYGSPLADDAISPLSNSLQRWPPFAEVPAALAQLRQAGYRLAILSNVDRDLIAQSVKLLGLAPDCIVTAEDVGSYKPATGHWRRFERDTGAGPSDTVHIAASQYHDIRTATELGYRTIWIDRKDEPLVGPAPTVRRVDLADIAAVVASLASGR